MNSDSTEYEFLCYRSKRLLSFEQAFTEKPFSLPILRLFLSRQHKARS